MSVATFTAPTAAVSASAASVTSGSFTPSANAVLQAFGTARKTSASIVTPVITDSLGLTWHLKGSFNYDPGSNPRMAGAVYIAFPGASPSAMTVTSTSTGANSSGLSVVETTGAALTEAEYANYIASAVSTTGDPSETLPNTPAASSAVIAFMLSNTTNLITSSPSGFTQLQEVSITTVARTEIAYDMSSPGAGPHAFASGGTAAHSILLEVPEPSGGGTPGNAPGAAFGETIALSAGAAIGAATAPGAAFGTTTALSAGAATGAASATGFALSVVNTFVGNGATGLAAASGSDLSITASFSPGTASGASAATGANLAINLTADFGAAEAIGTAGNAPGAAFVATTVTLAAGSASGAASAPGFNLNISLSSSFGAAFGGAMAPAANFTTTLAFAGGGAVAIPEPSPGNAPGANYVITLSFVTNIQPQPSLQLPILYLGRSQIIIADNDNKLVTHRRGNSIILYAA